MDSLTWENAEQQRVALIPSQGQDSSPWQRNLPASQAQGGKGVGLAGTIEMGVNSEFRLLI